MLVHKVVSKSQIDAFYIRRIDGLDPETNYNVTVFARYFSQVDSEPIQGNVSNFGCNFKMPQAFHLSIYFFHTWQATTLPFIERTCSCETYVQSQAKMQSTLLQLVQHIQVLSER